MADIDVKTMQNILTKGKKEKKRTAIKQQTTSHRPKYVPIKIITNSYQ